MTLTGGWAVGDYNGFGLGSGGALLTQYGSTLLHDLVVRDNLAQDQGAGVYSASRLPVERSPFDGHSTLGPILFSGGGIFVTDTPWTTTLEGSIVAGNLDSGPDEAPDLDGLDFVSLSHNLVGVRRGNGASALPAGQPNASDDWVGTLVSSPRPKTRRGRSSTGGRRNPSRGR